MQKPSKRELAYWAMALLPLVLVALCYERLPERIPMQWDLNGGVRYDAKWQLWIVSALSPFFAVLFRVLPQIDPKKTNYRKFAAPYRVFQWFMLVFLAVVVGMVLLESFRPGTVDVGVTVTILVALLFMGLGNMMPKFRRNFFCGIKTPWTLSSDSVWTRTHRLGGRLLFATGVLLLPSVLLPATPRFVAMMLLLAAATLIPAVMSYFWYRKEQKNAKETQI